jgi:circadian clock protein KaiC
VAGQRAIYFSFEESPEQIVRNMRSVGLDLDTHVAAGLLRFESSRPSLFGLEMHLVLMIRQIDAFDPAVVVVDPISAFRGSESEIHATLLRLVDYLKVKGITVVFNNLVNGDQADRNEQSLSSLMDVWIGLHDLEANGERNRGLFVLKARGMSHSNQIREYRLGSNGVTLIEPYIGPNGVLTGSARIVQEAQEEAAALERRDEVNRRQREFAEKKGAAERQIAETREALQHEEAELLALDTVDERKEQILTASRSAAATRRGAAT